MRLIFPFFQFHFELETWTLWILNQEWELKSYTGGAFDDVEFTTVYWPVTKDGGIELNRIVDALESFAGDELKLRRSPLKNQSGWTQEISPEMDEDQATAKELRDVANRGRGDADLDKVLNWAKSHPGKRLQGNYDYRPRKIGSVADPESIIADAS